MNLPTEVSAAGPAQTKLSGHVVKSTVAAALGGLLFGFDTAVIAGTTSALTHTYGLSAASLGITVASALWGTILGAIFAGIPGDRYGRRDSLRGMAVLYFISALGCAFAWNWGAFVAFRFIGGLAIGGSSVLGPMYIAEIAPARWRGRLVGFFQLNVVAGILLAYFSNYLIGLAGLGSMEWRAKLGIAAIPALFFFLMLFAIPRSPRWLVKVGRIEEAERVLKSTEPPTYRQELDEITASIKADRNGPAQRLFTWKHWLPVFLAITIGLFNQLSGINAILYYLNDIFAAAGFNKVSSDLQAVIIGFTNLVFTMLGMTVIDKLGRRALLLTGSIGTAGCLAGVAWVFLGGQHQRSLVWFLVAYIGFFALSQGAVIWVYISEIFPNTLRAKGQSLGSFSHWFANAIISGIFPLMAGRSGGYPFVFFAFMMAVQFVTVLLLYPETKGVSLEELEHKLKAA
jgi:SP family arabinose:H+ symporter-like MFS transporter